MKMKEQSEVFSIGLGVSARILYNCRFLCLFLILPSLVPSTALSATWVRASFSKAYNNLILKPRFVASLPQVLFFVVRQFLGAACILSPVSPPFLWWSYDELSFSRQYRTGLHVCQLRTNVWQCGHFVARNLA